MQVDPRYDDLLREVRAGLETAVATAEAAGVAPDSLCVDPGIGFGKTVGHNLTLLKRLDALRPLGKPILVGPSRKSFIGALLDVPPAERLEGTLAASVMAVMAGAHIVRVHDVAAVRRAVRVAEAIRDADPGCWIWATRGTRTATTLRTSSPLASHSASPARPTGARASGRAARRPGRRPQ